MKTKKERKQMFGAWYLDFICVKNNRTGIKKLYESEQKISLKSQFDTYII